ncbi:MAG: glycosyltransferase family 9 protein [Limisphaerales bacterium]
MNILIVKLSALGDVTHVLPALTVLRRARPDAHITWLVEESARELIEGHPAIDSLLVWRRATWKGLLRSGRWPTLATAVTRFVRELRRTRYDLVIDFQGLLKSALWVALARAGIKAGYGPGQRHDEHAWHALNRRIPVTLPDAHAVERNLNLVHALGFPRLPLTFDLPIAPARQEEADALLDGLGLKAGTRFVAVSAMTRWPTKNWTAAHFAEVSDRLVDAGVPVVFTGAPGDRLEIDAIAAATRHPLRRLDGKTALPTLAGIFRRATTVLSTDTGPMHIAVAAGTPVVALFGPTSADYTGPYGEDHIVLRAGLGCSPCYQRTCRTTEYEPHACMRRLAPEQVAAAVLQRLGDR